MANSTAQLIPFGKYRGQPVEVLMQDREYLQWLLAQSWFVQRYESLHMVVINQGVVPEETPEHNALQLQFLDIALCIQACHAWQHFWVVVDPQRVVGVMASVKPALFEQKGVDVTIDYSAWLWKTWEVRNKSYEWETLTGWQLSYGTVLTIELKPSLGDDYPAILRKMLTNGVHMLVFDHWTSAMPQEQVRLLFARSGRLLSSLDSLTQYPTVLTTEAPPPWVTP